MAVDLEEFVQEPAMMYLTTWTWKDGMQQQRLLVSAMPVLVRQLLRYGIDFSVTRNP